jgi:predicted nucleic acid-binding protein
MSWLLDTNVLLRLADAQGPDHAVAEAAIEHLLAGEESVFITDVRLIR